MRVRGVLTPPVQLIICVRVFKKEPNGSNRCSDIFRFSSRISQTFENVYLSDESNVFISLIKHHCFDRSVDSLSLTAALTAVVVFYLFAAETTSAELL